MNNLASMIGDIRLGTLLFLIVGPGAWLWAIWHQATVVGWSWYSWIVALVPPLGVLYTWFTLGWKIVASVFGLAA